MVEHRRCAIRPVVARPSPAPEPLRVRFAEFDLDEANASLRRGDRPVALPPTPFALLCALARRPGALLSKDALLDSVWGHQFVSESVLKTAISDLRNALGDDPRQPRVIETVPRRGYRFIAGAVEAAHMAPPSLAAAPASAAVALAPQDPAFIGRAAALDRLARAWQAASHGRRQIVWIAGEPGIGKTTLIENFAARLGPAAVARGHCVESYGAGEPYLPVLEGLAAACRIDPALADLLRTVAPTWLLQLPWLCTPAERDALRRELAGVGPERMLREFGELLDRGTKQRPLLLVTEDLHWSDRATLQLLDYLARRRGPSQLMWLASFRLAEVVALDHPLNPLRHELRLHGLCEEIVLDPFSETEVAAYVGHLSPVLAADEDFVRTLHARTDGVPLFVASVLKEAAGDDAAAVPGPDAARHAASVAIPENLVAIIDRAIARLPALERNLLSAAAVCGTEFRAGTVARMLECDAADVAHMCGQLAREQLLLVTPGTDVDTDDAPYAFRHALYRQVVYERLAPIARTQWHARAGLALEQEQASGVAVAPGELAMHFGRGRQPLAALRHTVVAAQAALQQHAIEACLAFTARAAPLVEQAPAGPERDAADFAAHTLRGVAAVHAAGMGADARDAFQRAYALLDRQELHPLRGLLLHGYGFLLSLRAEYAQALAVAGRTEALPHAQDDSALQLAAGIIRAEVDLLQGRPRAACAGAEDALGAVVSLPAAPDLVSVADPQVALLGMLGMELVHLGQVEDALARLAQARERALRLREPMARLVALWYEALVAVRLCDTQGVARTADAMDALADEHDLAQGRAARRWFRGWAEARSGRALEGWRRIREAYEENTRLGMLSGGSEVLGYAAEALLLAGDLAGAQRELDDALRAAQVQGERVYLPQLHLLQSAIAAGRGDGAGARAAVQRALDEARTQDAPGLELLALTRLCGGGNGTPQDEQALAALAARLPQMHGVIDRAAAAPPLPR